MPEDVHHEPGVAVPEPPEIALRDFPAGDVVAPFEAEHLLLHRTQAAVLQAMSQKAPRRMKEIEVRQPRQRIGEAVHDEPGGKEIDVEGFAVESHEKALRLRQFAQIREARPLLRVVPDE